MNKPKNKMNLQDLTKLIYENNISELRTQFEKGIDFNTLESYDKGSLLIAYSSYGYSEHYSQSEMIEFLIECGADVNHRANGRNNSKSALHNAAAMGHMEIVKTLIDNDAIIEVKDKNGNTPLWNKVMMYRGKDEDKKMIEYLISKGSSLDTKNNHGNSARDIITQNDIKDASLKYLL